MDGGSTTRATSPHHNITHLLLGYTMDSPDFYGANMCDMEAHSVLKGTKRSGLCVQKHGLDTHNQA